MTCDRSVVFSGSSIYVESGDKHHQTIKITTRSHLNLLNIKKKTMEMPGFGLRQVRTCGRVKLVNEIPNLPFFIIESTGQNR